MMGVGSPLPVAPCSTTHRQPAHLCTGCSLLCLSCLFLTAEMKYSVLCHIYMNEKTYLQNTSQPLQIWVLPKYYMLSSFHFSFYELFCVLWYEDGCTSKNRLIDWIISLFCTTAVTVYFKKVAHFPPISTLWD